MRELFGPVSTNVNWYNDSARGYNKTTKKESEGRGHVKVSSRFSNKVRYKEDCGVFMLTQCRGRFPFKELFCNKFE